MSNNGVQLKLQEELPEW